MKIDWKAVAAYLAELDALDVKLADAGPHKVLPRPPSDLPDRPALIARRAVLIAGLTVRRAYKVPQGHDLDGNGQPIGYDLHETGTIEEIRAKSDRLGAAVRVHFTGSGAHLWFKPEDLARAK